MLDLLRSSPLSFVLLAGVLLLSLAFHELAHAFAADRMGDTTARNLGRLTFDPLKHLDPLGTLLIFIAGFGWARPVPIRPSNFRNLRWGLFVVSIAGVLVNIAIALMALASLAALGVRQDAFGITVLPDSQAASLSQSEAGAGLLTALLLAARINIVLTVFNLLPIPPLDGSKALAAWLPEAWQQQFWKLERYGMLIVIVLLVGFQDQVSQLINWVMSGMMQLILA
ncbi:MAG: site-2 protease family protein [Deinococcota bacterium]